VVRAIDHDIATGVWPDMTKFGYPVDEWPALYERVLAADIPVLCGPIWLGDNSSIMDYRQGDGVKHCATNVLYRLQHLGYTFAPQADAGWIGEAGPGEVLSG
jgi:hypothetical protein